jgi:hypothetical protein
MTLAGENDVFFKKCSWDGARAERRTESSGLFRPSEGTKAICRHASLHIMIIVLDDQSWLPLMAITHTGRSPSESRVYQGWRRSTSVKCVLALIVPMKTINKKYNSHDQILYSKTYIELISTFVEMTLPLSIFYCHSVHAPTPPCNWVDGRVLASSHIVINCYSCEPLRFQTNELAPFFPFLRRHFLLNFARSRMRSPGCNWPRWEKRTPFVIWIKPLWHIYFSIQTSKWTGSTLKTCQRRSWRIYSKLG